MLCQAVPPISNVLRAKGCKLVRSTTLRDPVARTASAAYYRGVAQVCTLASAHKPKGPSYKLNTCSHWQANYSSWVASRDGSNGMVRWLLHGNPPTAGRERFAAAAAAAGRPLTDEGQLRWVTEVLSHFDLVGRTEQLAGFIAAARAVLGWPLFAAPLAAKNPTPPSNRYALSPAERRWTEQHTSLDASLVDHFCAARGAGCVERSSSARIADALPV